MKCPHCKKELGKGDAYDLMYAHRWDCFSKVGNAMSDALEDEYNGLGDE